MVAKLQIIQISFIIFSFFTLLLGYFFLVANFYRRVERIFEERKIDIFENLNNIILAYSKLSLYYAATQNLREEFHVWIHNGFNPLNFDFLKECKENITKHYLNLYLSKFHVFLPVTINISKVDECFWNISRENVLNGKHDESHFYVNCSQIKIIIYTNDTILQNFAEVKNYITNNRYWYLYRKIYEWAKENGDKFASCVCSLVTSCTNCNSINLCYQNLFESLEKKFEDDKYIKCKEINEKSCCYQEFGESCRDIDGCYFWTKNICYLSPSYECPNMERFQTFYSEKSVLSSLNNVVYFTCRWFENRIETSKIYECEDYKYYESTPYGPDKIIFRIGVFAGWKNYKACKETIRCYYSLEGASCERCINDLCERCFLSFISCEKQPCFNPPNYMECERCKIRECQGNVCRVESCEACKNKDERC